MSPLKRIIFCSLFCLPVSLAFGANENAKPHTIHSPNQHIKVDLSLIKGAPKWSIRFGNRQVIARSALGFQPKSAPYQKLHETSWNTDSSDSTWKPTWGKFSTVRDHYQEARWTLQESTPKKRSFTIVVRAYDNAVSVRYLIDGTGKETFSNDQTSFNFTKNHTCWSANAEHPNYGPVKLSQWKGHQLPLTVQVAEDCYASIVEANIKTFAFITLNRTAPTHFRARLPQSTVSLPAQTSWRTILLGKNPGELLTNNTVINLNPAPQGDFSWVKTGSGLWDWREWGAHVPDGTKDGFTYKLGMLSWKRQIDFASKHKLRYLLLDAGWYGLEFDPKEDPTTCRDHLIFQPDPKKADLVRKPAPKNWKHPIDVPAIIRYAKTKNVGIILYLNDAAQKQHDLNKTLATYEKWGAAGIKYGFMRTTPQLKVLKTRHIVQLCAKHRLLCDFHDGPVPPSGERRTFPNYITREFCHSQSDGRRTFSPKTFCTTVFTNMVLGPLDMCNGLYAINGAKQSRPKIFAELYSTVAGETARNLITFTGVAILPDIPEAYEKKSDLFEFIAKLPHTWDETLVFNAKIGHSITTARRSGDDWFIGSCCDEQGATLPITLDFLKPNTTYNATLYEDGPHSHFKKNREDYKIRHITVKKGDTIKVKLAPGGGNSIHLTPQK